MSSLARTSQHMSGEQAWKVFGSIIFGGAMFISGVNMVTGEDMSKKTHNKQWKTKEESYKRAQQMNPVGLGLRKKYEPDYLKKSSS